jgi:hypothetical protein
MNSKTFDFSYDHAAGFFDKDLWSDNTALTPSSRTGVAGYAYVGSVCTNSRYSIEEDIGNYLKTQLP